jgi:hypothetical protein
MKALITVLSETEGNVNSRVIISNPDEQPVSGNMLVFDPEGAQLDDDEFTLPPYAQHRYDLHAVDHPDLPQGYGKIEVRSDRPLTGQVSTYPELPSNWKESILQNDTLLADAVDLPEVVTGDPENTSRTTLVNPFMEPVSGVLKYSTTEGDQNDNFVLLPHESLEITSDAGNVISNVKVEMNGEDKILGKTESVIKTVVDNQQIEVVSSKPLSETGSSLSGLFVPYFKCDAEAGSVTAILLNNQTDQNIHAELAIYDMQGMLVAGSVIDIPGKGETRVDIQTLLPENVTQLEGNLAITLPETSGLSGEILYKKADTVTSYQYALPIVFREIE